MIYRVSEDQAGRVTVSEIDPATRRVLRSARVRVDFSEKLMMALAKCIESNGFVRRRLHAGALAALTGPSLFSMSGQDTSTGVSDTKPVTEVGTPPRDYRPVGLRTMRFGRRGTQAGEVGL